MNVGRPVSEAAQAIARELIRREGLARTAQQLEATEYMVARAASGAGLVKFCASALEKRLLSKGTQAA